MGKTEKNTSKERHNALFCLAIPDPAQPSPAQQYPALSRGLRRGMKALVEKEKRGLAVQNERREPNYRDRNDVQRRRECQKTAMERRHPLCPMQKK
ncbi:hypothetical protein VTH06DRAFT_7347 [Thermothelomyces fergusii]